MTPTRLPGGYRCLVEERISDFVRTWWFESLAVVLALAGVVEGLFLAAPDGVSRGPGWFLPFGVALMAVPLLFVKRFPFGAPIATVLSADLIAFATTGRLVTDGFVAIFLLNLAAWQFGRLDRRSSVMGLLVLLVTVVVVDSQADKMTGAAIVFPWIFFTTFWAASVFVTARGVQVREAEDRAEQLAFEQEQAAVRAVAEERQRIARELHDVIAHSVSVMTVQAGAVRRLLLPEQERERQALEVVESTGREALTEMRRLVGLLREHGTMPEFAPQPSLRTLDILIGTVREAGLEVDLDVQGEEHELPPGVDLSAYRLVQEALTNTLKYAGPAQAWVTLRWREHELEIEVANNGRSEASSNGSGHGLAGMRERVALCGGTLETGPRDGGGFVVRCHLPLESAG